MNEHILNKYYQLVKKYYSRSINDAEIIETWEPTNKYVQAGMLDVSTISDKIRKSLAESVKCGYTVYTYPRGRIQITIPTSFERDLDEIKCMMRRAYTMRKVCGDRILNTISILYFPTEFKKKLPTTRKPLSAHHINNGITDVGKVVLIFRQEDMPKVLLHEMIHYFGMDRPYIKYNVHPSLYFMYQKLSSALLIEEVATETMAYMWHIVMTSIDLDVEPLVVYRAEVEYGIKQSAKLLKYFGFESIDTFERGCCLNADPVQIQCRSGTCPMLEVITPAVAEYYILRTALLFDLERANTAIIDPGKTMEMLTDSFNDPTFRAMIDIAINHWLPLNVGGSSLKMSVTTGIKKEGIVAIMVALILLSCLVLYFF